MGTTWSIAGCDGRTFGLEARTPGIEITTATGSVVIPWNEASALIELVAMAAKDYGEPVDAQVLLNVASLRDAST